MPRATRPTSLPPDLLDGLQDALDRIEAVADLLALVRTAGDPGFLRKRTVSGAASIIENETSHIRQLIAVYAKPDPTES